MSQISFSLKNHFVSQDYSHLPGLGLASCGHWSVKDHLVKDRTRDDFLVIYCTNGSGSFTLRDKNYEVSQGDIFFAFPDIPHGYCCDENGWEIWFIHFGGDQSLRLVNWAGFNITKPINNIGIQNDLITIFEQIAAISCEKDINYEISVIGFLYQLLLMLKQHNQISSVHNKDFLIGVSKNTDSIEEMASIAGMSKYHYIREFKKALGITPWQYVMNRKIANAKELLMENKYSIKEISYKLGFKDPNYFSRFFCQKTGQTAAKFKKNNC